MTFEQIFLMMVVVVFTIKWMLFPTPKPQPKRVEVRQSIRDEYYSHNKRKG